MQNRASEGSRSGQLWTEWWRAVLALLVVFLMGGCSSAQYRERADRQVYQLIQQAQAQVFGRTNRFSIDTPWSDRDPQAIAPEEVFADRGRTNELRIDLQQALDLAVRNSREYQLQKEQLYLAALNLTGQRHRFEPNLIGTAAGTLSGDGGGNEVLGNVNSRLGVSQLLKSGGSLSLQLANDLLRYYTGDPRESVVTVLSVDVMQPLLRGFGKNSDAVEALTQAERNLIYAIRDFDQFQKQFAVDIISSYFSLLGQKDVVRNNYTNYLRRVETTRYLEARSVGRARRSEVDDARAAELGARIAYINSVAAYLSQLDAFKIQLGLPVSTQLYSEDRDLEELVQHGLVPVEVDQRVAFGLAVQRHADILNAIDRFEDRKRKVRLAADKLKPGLNLVANADYRASESIDYTDFDPDKFTYRAGLELDLPLDRLDERNAFRTILIQFEQQLRSLSLTLDQFRDRIDRGLRTLEQRRLNYLDRLAELEVNRRRVEQSQILLQAGRAQIRDLREAQDLLISAQNAVTSTRVDYLRARLQLLLDMGVLPTEGDRFWLHDPLPELIGDEQRGTNPLRMPEDQVLPPNHFLEARHETE